MNITGPSFLALQVRDVERSAQFYETRLGLRRAPIERPAAVVFATTPIPFAVRAPLPGVDLDAGPRPGLGVAIWLLGTEVQQLHDELVEAGTPILAPPAAGPFGLAFTFADPDGYAITVHEGE